MNIDFALCCFLNSWWACSFPMHGLHPCLWVVLENSSLIAGTVITLSKYLGFSSICFEMSAQISWRFFFLIASWKLWNNLCTDFCHMQIVMQYLPHCLFVNGHPLCYQSNTKPTIFSNNFFNFSDIVSGFGYGWASWTFIIFNISPAFTKSFVPFKNAGSWHAFFVVNFHRSLNFTKNFKLILCSVLELNIFLRLQQNFLQQWAIYSFCKSRFCPTRKKACTCF